MGRNYLVGQVITWRYKKFELSALSRKLDRKKAEPLLTLPLNCKGLYVAYFNKFVFLGSDTFVSLASS